MVYTEGASRELANKWWEKKLAELEGNPQRVDDVQEMLNSTDDLSKQVKQLQQLLHERDTDLFKLISQANQSDKSMRQFIAQSPEVDRLKTTGKAEAPEAEKFSVHAERFLSIIQGKSKPLTYREIRDYVKGLTAECGELPVTAVNEDFVERVYLSVKSSAVSDGTKKKRWGFFRRLIEYFAEKGLCPQPRNLHSKEYKFRQKATAVKVYDTQAVRSVLKSLTPRQRLYALLGLNAGMTSADIGQLTKDMISPDGVLTRKRVKTSSVSTVPTVSYKLWPEVVALIAECGNHSHPTLVLTGQTGEALWTSRQEADGSTPQKDMLSQQWKRAKIAIPHKAFRSISATRLESHSVYGRFTEMFLGHSPKTIKDRHYAAPSQELFNQALEWLREDILVEPKKK